MSRFLLLFDCDGTLVDSQHDIVTAMDFAFTNQGLRPPTRSATLAIVGLSVPEALLTLAPTLSSSVREALAQDFRSGAPSQRETGGRDNPLYPGATEIIARYAGRDDVVLGIATGKSRRGVNRLFDQYDWHPHFATVQTADTNRSKPDPEMITAAMADVGAEPARTIMIGDTSFDIAMANAAGVHSIGVGWGYHPPHALTAAGAPIVVQSFADLATAIDRLRI